LAEFINPAGLLRSGNSMWSESNNSGEGILHKAGEGTSSTIKPGAVEMSNVDLASEFTDLITTQRGYQANARIISTTDNLLQELVQLVR
jgi:flagellar hook protein FlgE